MGLHAITTFLSAALLFQVQLLMGSQLLPWFGGGAGVWTACLAFFQTALLVGYAYAHVIAAWPARRQVVVHALLVALSLALLSITPGDGWKPEAAGEPVLQVLAILAVHVGLPFVVLSASAILLQRWLDVERPWVLYAASNAGALLGLLAYPFVVEPQWTRAARAAGWSGAYAAFALLVLVCGWRRWRSGEFRPAGSHEEPGDESRSARVLWIVLPACSTAAMLAVTSQLAEFVPPTPFLWVLPLALHLATFVIAFAGERCYPRRLTALLLALSSWPLLNALYTTDVDTWPRLIDSLAGRVLALSATLFLLCLACHGELYRARPHRARLSSFYLSIAFGGALGGMAMAVAAPLLLDGPLELNIVLVFTALVLTWSLARGGSSRPAVRAAALVAVLLAAGLGARLALLERALRTGAVEQTRNFYGSLAVYDLNPTDPVWHRLSLVHGTIEHGHQFQRPEWRGLPSTYFTPSAGAGLALTQHAVERTRSIGVVGLGVGTLAAYGREGDSMRFYELDPNVVTIARGWFDYLARCRAEHEVILGDARLSLEREQPNGFDVLVLDAFTADVVPVHLLTRESFELYLEHLAPDGVLALHVTSQVLDFRPVLATMARELGLQALHVSTEEGPDGDGPPCLPSDWVLMTRNRDFLANPRVRLRAQMLRPDGAPLWTDERAPLLDLIDWD